MAGMKEVLGLWTSANEGAKFWLQVLTEMQNRGLKDIFIACVDGLKGFPQAVEAVYTLKRAARYMRVGTVDQHPETQLHELRHLISGKCPSRPKLSIHPEHIFLVVIQDRCGISAGESTTVLPKYVPA